MSKKDFTYAVSRIRMKENLLFSAKTIDRLIAAPDYDSLVRTLAELGYGSDKDDKEQDIISLEQKKLWSLMDELTDDMDVFNVFRIQNDFHNIKASVKALYTNTSPESMFVSGGTVSPQKLYVAAKKRDYSDVAPEFAEALDEALDTILKTGDGQLCDIIVDKACLNAVFEIGEKSDVKAIKDYAEVFVASSNIKIAFRGAKLNKSRDFFSKALSRSVFDNDKLSIAAAKGTDEICDYLSTTKFKDATEFIKKSMSAFEKWCDDFLINNMKPQKSEPFSAGPLVAYIIAKLNEIKSVRLILVAKLNGLDDNKINERIREMYV